MGGGLGAQRDLEGQARRLIRNTSWHLARCRPQWSGSGVFCISGFDAGECSRERGLHTAAHSSNAIREGGYVSQTKQLVHARLRDKGSSCGSSSPYLNVVVRRQYSDFPAVVVA
jgi:hypothetical protein